MPPQGDHAERYYQLALLGREAFVASVAPAALVRPRTADEARPPERMNLHNIYSEDTLLAHINAGTGEHGAATGQLEIYPLAKKLNAPFADMITVGRTTNNDVVLRDITVSRFHAFFRHQEDRWVVCDAGSKNGTFHLNKQLEARKERVIESGDTVRIGDISTTFYTAADLYEVLRPDDDEIAAPRDSR